MTTNPECNIVLNIYKINVYLKFSNNTGEWQCHLAYYTHIRLCFRAQWQYMIYWCTASIGHERAINGREVQLKKYNKSNAVACRLRPCNSLLRQCRVIENVKYFRYDCVCVLVVGWFMVALLTLW